MCFYIILEGFWLTYVPNSIALTDPPEDLLTFMKQRWRWTNGSLFSSIHVLGNCSEIWNSNHKFFTKLLLFCSVIYTLLSTIMTLTLVANLFAGLSLFVHALLDPLFDINKCSVVWNFSLWFDYIYTILLLLYGVSALAQPLDHPKAKRTLHFFVFCFGVLMTFSTIIVTIKLI